jgi:hypothetical protein
MHFCVASLKEKTNVTAVLKETDRFYLFTQRRSERATNEHAAPIETPRFARVRHIHLTDKIFLTRLTHTV